MVVEGKLVQVLAAVASSLTLTSTGFVVAFSSFALPQMVAGEGGLKLDEEQGSWFASIYAVGCLTGSVFGAIQCDKLGRKKSLLIDCLSFVLASLCMYLAPSFSVLMLGRWLGGHASGSSYVAAPIFLSETSHPSVRNVTGTLPTVFYTMGFCTAMLLGALLSWRNVLLVATAAPTLSAFLLFFLAESPTWLMKVKREDQALAALVFYRKNEDSARLELERVGENIRMLEKEAEADGTTITGKLRALWKRMLDSSFWKPFLLLNLILNIGLEFGGFPALAFYMHTILKRAEVPFDVYWVAVCVSAYRMFGVMITSLLMSRVPRKTMYMGSGFLVLLSLIIQGSYETFSHYLPPDIHAATTWLPLAGILVQYTGFALGYGPIVFILQGEILPSDMRSFGSGLLGVLDNVFLFGAVKSVPLLMHSFGTGGTFYFYSVCVAFTLIISFLVMPETKGLSLEDIEDYYRVKKSGKRLSICH